MSALGQEPTFVIPGLAKREPGTQGVTSAVRLPPGFRIALAARPE